MIKKIAALGVMGMLVFGLFGTLLVSQVNATPPNDQGEHKIEICHARNAVNNAYGPQRIEVDLAAVDGQGGADHYGQHQGPLASSLLVATALKALHIQWGDIIPPTEAQPTGLNWTAAGQAIWNNNCQYPKLAAASVSTTPATCEMGETLVYGNIVNATFSGTANGTEGPANYSVTATANADSLFIGNQTTKEFNGTLAGQLTGEQCDEPEALVATASVSTTAATCEAGEKLIYGNIENATFSGTADGTEGPADYSVVATADKGAEFDGNQATKTFEGTLEAQLTGDDCVLGENPDPETPTTPGGQGETPEVLPNTGANTAFGLYAILAGLAGLVSAVAVAVRKSAFRGL